MSNGAEAETVTRGVKLNLSTGSFYHGGLTLEGTGTAQINSGITTADFLLEAQSR